MTMHSQLYRERFLDIVRHYNENIVNTTLMFTTHDLRQYRMQTTYQHSSTEDDAHAHLTTEARSDDNYHSFPGVYKYVIKKIENMQENLTNYTKQLNYFYAKNDRYYYVSFMTVISLSASLSIFDTLLLTFSTRTTDRLSSVTSVIVSSCITVLTANLRYKNVKYIMEEIVRVREKINVCQSKLFLLDKDMKSFYCDTNV